MFLSNTSVEERGAFPAMATGAPADTGGDVSCVWPKVLAALVQASATSMAVTETSILLVCVL